MAVLGFAQAPPPGGTVNTGGTAGDYKSSTAEGGADRIFNVNSDSVDMENGSMQWKGTTMNLGNARAVRARFERFLAAPTDSGDMKRYVAILDQIQFLLSAQSINQENYYRNQQEAFNLLFKAAEFDIDANNSLTIASQVQKVWVMKQEFRQIEINKNQLETLRKMQEGIIINRADIIEDASDARSRSQGNSKTGSLGKASSGTTELGFKVKDEARTQAQILARDAEMTALGLKAKIEFQSQMVSFLMARRYRHSLITSSFYRVLFKGGSQNIVVGAKEVKEFFPISDFVPTLESFDMLSREAIKDVTKGVQTVDDLVKQGELYGAFERLQETFFLGEFEPSVMMYDQARKRDMLELWRDLRELQRLGDEHDLANVEGYVNKVRGRARDFPGAAILSKVNNAINASNMAVLSAKQAALTGDTAKAEAALERATKIWPQNPAVKDFANQVVSRQDTLAQKIPEFDRMVSEAKWRDIFNKKLEFALALAQDKTRSDKLRQVVNRIGELDANIQKAQVLASQNNPYLAWDVIVETSRAEPDDLVLAKTRSDIAPLVADYARVIGIAEKLEKDGGEAAALTAWLQAQDLNPASPACGAAIKRLAGSLAQGAPAKATAAAPTPPAAGASGDEVAVPPRR
jgi:tetratricopeptide (TPR) repeat protein